MKTSQDEFVRGGGGTPPCAGVTPNVLSEVQTPIEEKNSQTGVSTRSALHEINAPQTPTTGMLYDALMAGKRRHTSFF